MPPSGVERRRHLRLYDPFPARVRAVNAMGRRFETETVLDTFSAGGLSRLPWRLAVEVKRCAVVRRTTASCAWAPAPCVAVPGVVQRVAPQPDGTCGVGVAFTRHRFL